MVRFLSLLSTLLLIHGCSMLSSTNAVPSKPPLVTVSKPFEPETLYSLMVAEIAGSQQQYKITLVNYVQQARKTEDVGVIARAANIAQFLGVYQTALEMGLLWLKNEPNSEEANTVVATALIATGKLVDALSYAEKVNEDGDTPLFETIALESRKSDASTRDDLIEAYSTLSITHPKAVSIKVGLSILYLLQNDTDKALAIVKEALEIDPDHVSAVIQQTKTLHLQEKNALAIKVISTALDKYPDNNRLRIVYARLLTKSDPKAAYQEFAYLSQKSPDQPDFKFSQALLALEMEDYDAAKPLLVALYASNYRPNDTVYYLGYIAEQNQQLDEALTHYLQVNQGTNFLSAHTRAAKIMIAKGGLQTARTHFVHLRKSHSNQTANLYAAEVSVLMNAQEHQLALRVLDEAITRFSDNISFRYNRSLLYEKLNQVQLMETDLRYILTLDPNNILALNALGYFLTSHTERHEEALVMIEKALSLRPDDPAIMDSMGWVLFHLGRYQQALNYLRKALDKFPDGEIAAHLGEVLWVIGEIEAAKDVWSQALARQPNDSRVLQTLERLNVSLD